MPLALPLSRVFAAVFVVLAAAIVWFSLTPMTAQPGVSQIDKIEHFCAYAALTFVGFAARGRPWPLLAAAIVIFGGGVEVLQALLPTGRTGSLLDALANAAGAGSVWAGWLSFGRLRRR